MIQYFFFLNNTSLQLAHASTTYCSLLLLIGVGERCVMDYTSFCVSQCLKDLSHISA